MQTNDCGTCTSKQHGSMGSKYASDKVPIKLFHKDPNDLTSKLFKTCYDCRSYQAKHAKAARERLQKKAEEFSDNNNNTDFQFCVRLYHTKNVSQYPRDKVPKSHFVDDINDPQSKKYVDCYDCRKYCMANQTRISNELRQKAEESKKTESTTILCPCKNHDFVSKHKRDSVPRELFRRYPEDPRSPLLDFCLDCREYASMCNERVREKKKESVGEGEFYCSGCKEIRPIEEKGTNLNGTEAANCIKCKIDSWEGIAENKIRLNKLKVKTILENKCSCMKCKSIFLCPEEGKFQVREFPTYLKDGKRYVKYENVEYCVEFFFREHEKLLELRILEYDHLTEQEQRERGILKEGDIFVPKRDNISQLTSDDAIEVEIRKVQLLCSRCHVEETQRREENKKLNGMRAIKQNYVNELKKEGCSVCGFYDPKLLRFLEFDHLNPPEKVEAVSRMIQDPSYDLEDVKKETDKKVTRILCRFCHVIHTSWQVEQGLIYNR